MRPQRFPIGYAALAVALLAVTLVLTAGQATAQTGQLGHPGDGHFPSWHDCEDSDRRVRPHDGWSPTASIYQRDISNDSREYIGWVEWRYSSACGHYQWVAVHFTEEYALFDPMWTLTRQSDGEWTEIGYTCDTGPCDFETEMLWAKDSLICLDLTGPDEGHVYEINANKHNANGSAEFCA